METIARCCPVCLGNESQFRFTKDALHVVRCLRCGMHYATPVSCALVSGDFYDAMGAPFYLSPDKLAGDYAPVRFRREIAVFRRYCKGGPVLDVGCSTGAFLHNILRRFPDQYEALGIDVAGPALSYAESQGIPVWNGSFLDFAPGRQYAAITFWAVLEHLNEPRAFLRKAFDLLEPGGHCFVLVPNFGSLATRILGSRYRYILPEHINYFHPRDVRHLIGHIPGARVERLTTSHFNPIVLAQDFVGRSRSVAASERASLLKRTNSLKSNPFLAPAAALYRILETLLGTVRLADNVLCVARKKTS